MKDLKGTKTEKNLQEAFAGESQARNKYTYFASKAKKDGYEQIAAFFEETANNEKEHAKLWFKYLDGVEENPELAVIWMRKAAEQGHSWAEYNLGVFYEIGYGVEKDRKEAMSWLIKSANHGNSMAADRLDEKYISKTFP